MATNYSIKKIISIIKSELKEFYPDNEVDSFINLIFENVLDYSRTQLLLSQDKIISDDIYLKIEQIISDLKNYKPIQYILGESEFYNIKLKIFRNVLIPRPETEELVDWIIRENSNQSIKILDIGTGSGCIAISLAKSLPMSIVYASDISEDALKASEYNSLLNNTQVHIINFNVLNPEIKLFNKFDIIISNPPYVTEKEKAVMHKNVLDFEPGLALFVPNKDPLIFYRSILNFGLNHLNKNGKIYFEINELYGKETKSLMQEKGFEDIVLKRDINGKDRMIKGKLKTI